MSLISVIVPIYNCEKHLKQCLDSLITQTYSDIEIILIDDGSKDLSGDICDRFAKEDERIIVKHKQNQGVAMAIEDGLLLSTGEKVVFIDSDDWVDNDYIEQLVSISDGVDIAISDYVRVNLNKETILLSSILDEGKYSIDELIQKDLIYMNDRKIVSNPRYAKIFDRKLALESVKKSNKSFKIGEDWQFIIYCLVNCKNIYVTHKFAKYYYRNNPDSVMNNYSSNLAEKYMTLVDDICLVAKNAGWSNVDRQINLARTETLLGAINNESRNKNKKLRKAELKKIIEFYKLYNLKTVKYVAARKKIYITYKVLNTCNLCFLRVFVSLVSLYYKIKMRRLK